MNLLLPIAHISIIAFSVLLYLLIIIVLIRNRHDKHIGASFFKISISLGIADVLLEIVSIFFVLNLQYGIAIDEFYISFMHGLWITFCDQWIWYLVMVQMLSIVIAAFNRFAAVIFKTGFDTIFSNRNTAGMIAITWILPFILVFPIPFLSQSEFTDHRINASVPVKNTMPAAGCSIVDEDIRNSYIMLIMFVKLISCSVSFVMYIATIAALIRMKKKSGDGNRNKWLVEMKLSLIVFVQIATGIVQLILLGVCMFVIVHGYSWLLFYVYLNEDVLTLSQPYLMLILSAKVRYAVMQQLGCLPLHRLSATIPV